MIVTSINSPELAKYAKTHSRFAEAFAEIKKYVTESLPDGKRVVDLGDELYANVFTYETKLESDSCFEAHKKYIDIQVVLDGEEIIGFESADKLTSTTEYDSEKDYVLYSLNGEYDKIRICKGEMAIIFPEEPHAPGITAADGPTTVRKMVVKVLAE